MLFRYHGWDSGGTPVHGELDAPSRGIALARLRQTGVLVDRIAPSLSLARLFRGKGGKLGLRQLGIFCSQLAMLLEGGIPLLQSLQVMAAQSKPPLKGAIAELAVAVEGGRPLSEALALRRDLFPSLMINVVAVCEVSGELSGGLHMLGRQFDREDQVQRKVKSAMVYPTVVMVMAFGLLFFMVGFMVPKYADMFGQLGAQLPGPTLLLMKAGKFVQACWYLFPPGFFGAFFGFRLAMSRLELFRLTVHRLQLRVPVFGDLALKRDLARYTQALATTMKSGVPVLQAVQSAAEVLENDYLARGLAQVADLMARGYTLTQALRQTGVLPPIMMELLGVGELIGNVDNTLQRVSGFLEADLNETVDRLTSILEPFLIVILGAIVLGTVVPMLLPMFDIYGKIS